MSSRPGAVVEVHHAVAEAAFVQQFEVEANMVGEGLFAASHYDRRDDEMVLVDQLGLDRLGGELRTAHRDVAYGSDFHLPDGPGVEVPLDPRSGAGCRLERLGVDDLVGRLP